jgi:hypothetical protein
VRYSTPHQGDNDSCRILTTFKFNISEKFENICPSSKVTLYALLNCIKDLAKFNRVEKLRVENRSSYMPFYLSISRGGERKTNIRRRYYHSKGKYSGVCMSRVQEKT